MGALPLGDPRRRDGVPSPSGCPAARPGLPASLTPPLQVPYHDPKLSRERSHRQRSARDLFGVTPRPYLPGYTGLKTFAGRIQDGWVREGAPTEVGLDGQEFLLFRGLRTEGDVEGFAGTYGLLELYLPAGEQAGVKRHMRPVCHAMSSAVAKNGSQPPRQRLISGN